MGLGDTAGGKAFEQQKQRSEQANGDAHHEQYLPGIGDRRVLDLGGEQIFGQRYQQQCFGGDQRTVAKEFRRPGFLGHGRSLTARALMLKLLMLCSFVSGTHADEAAGAVVLQAPLTTIVTGWSRPESGEAVLRAVVEVPDDAPPDLGVGAWVGDRHGRWFQRIAPGILTPGRHVLSISLADGDSVQAEPVTVAARWNRAEAAIARQGGLFFWSQHASRATLRVTIVPPEASTVRLPPIAQVRDVQVPPPPRTGERWEIRCAPAPYPANPCDPAEFRLDLLVRDPLGRDMRIPAFHDQPMRSHDRGDREEVLPAGPAAFAARWRASMPGRHTLKLDAQWRQGDHLLIELPDQVVSGDAWDDIARVDASDTRFLSANGRMLWPNGPNLRSVWDLRCRERLGTTLTIDRGTLSYDAYLTRAAAGGADACEIWLSSWNLALEWNGAWDGFHGTGRWNLANAWKVDRILARAEALGIRVNLVISNHGQASENTDREWDNNPWNRTLGGPLTSAAELFTDRRASTAQAALRRYLVGRYGDSPALLAWKLWSEINLTAGTRDSLGAWHTEAATQLHALDPWRHPVTTHWSGDFRTVDPGIAALPAIDLLCIDAYHAGPEENGMNLAELLGFGLSGATGRSLSRYAKPVLITEYGGNWSACPPAQMDAEFRSGPWLALTNGYVGGPMLWWFEWIDQHQRWGQYGAAKRFLVGEDLRGVEARTLPLTTSAPGIMGLCWSRPGRRLGYLLDRTWGTSGSTGPLWKGVTIDNGAQVPAGRVGVEWWDADTGAIITRRVWNHPGGPLILEAPAFSCHLAFKLWRTDSENSGVSPAQTPVLAPSQAP